MKSKIRLQPSFILSYLAIGVLAVATVLVNNSSLLISADTFSSKYANTCAKNPPLFSGESTVTDQEKLNYGDNAKAWVIKTKQNQTFRIIVGARQLSSADNGGYVEFTVALGNLNNTNFSDKKGRVWLWVGSSSTPLDYIYDWNKTLKLQPNKYWVGQKNVLVKNYNTDVSFEIVNGSEKHRQGCISKAFNVAKMLGIEVPTTTASPTATASASATATVTATASATATPTASATATTTATVTASATTTATPALSLTVGKGFSAQVIPESVGAIDATPILDAGMYVYEYNISGGQDWTIYAAGENSTYMYPGVGYYIYNPSGEATISLYRASLPDETGLKTSLRRGWNLVSNSDSATLALEGKSFSVLKTDAAASCALTTCFETKTLKELLEQKRVYGTLYLIVDKDATSASEAFQTIKATSSNLASLSIAAETPYWIYLYK